VAQFYYFAPFDIVSSGDDFEHTILQCADHLFDNQQLGEYKSLTPTYLLKQDTSQLPDIDVSTVKKYLLNRKAQEFTSTSLRHYKLS
jgi:hypothetical protein